MERKSMSLCSFELFSPLTCPVYIDEYEIWDILYGDDDEDLF